MSHSPDDLPDDATLGDLDPAYVQSVVKLNQMLDRGVSWSGHEANCCFLNIGSGNGKFANVSAITGLDFLDDGRGLALVDWDRDGDLDAWTSNRTAPMLRFVRNDTPVGMHYLAIRLEGVECNRDAIGARVVVELGGESPTKLARTLHAGEGFLGQSSKWLHFGLGDQPEIEQLTVYWPHGEPEVISDIRADRRYKIRQGTGSAVAQPAEKAAYNLAAAPVSKPLQSVQSRALLSSRLPVPPLRLQTYDGRELDATAGADGPVLLNIWATWCRPCLAELRELSEREDELRAAGMNVYAANVDGLGDKRGTDFESHRALLNGFGYPYEAGVAPPALAATMETIVNFVYGPNRPLPVPTSFLFDSSGQLAAVYKGGVTVDQLLADVETLTLKDDEFQQAALPFKGRWLGRLPVFRPIGLAAAMAEADINDELLRYLSRYAAVLSQDSGYVQLASEIARRLMLDERWDEALSHLRAATDVAPQAADLWAWLGEVQLQLGDTTQADRSLRRALTIDVSHPIASFQIGNLLSRQRKLAEAARFYERALKVRPDLADAHYQLSAVLFQLRQTDDAVRHLERFVELRPEDTNARVNLGGLLASLWRLAEAEKQLEKAIQVEPDNSMARNNLGRVLQDQSKDGAAVEQFEIAMRSTQSALPAAMNLAKLLATTDDQAVRDEKRAIAVAQKCVDATSGKRADALGVLAVALSSAGQHGKAVETATKALRIAEAQGDARLIAQAKSDLQRFQSKQSSGSATDEE